MVSVPGQSYQKLEFPLQFSKQVTYIIISLDIRFFSSLKCLFQTRLKATYRLLLVKRNQNSEFSQKDTLNIEKV